MEVYNTIEPAVYPKNNKPSDTDTFENDWKNAISGDEFVRRATEHLKKLYALRDKQQADN